MPVAQGSRHSSVPQQAMPFHCPQSLPMMYKGFIFWVPPLPFSSRAFVAHLPLHLPSLQQGRLLKPHVPLPSRAATPAPHRAPQEVPSPPLTPFLCSPFPLQAAPPAQRGPGAPTTPHPPQSYSPSILFPHAHQPNNPTKITP